MPNTVHVPLLGEMSKGSLAAGMVAVVGVGGYLIYKHEKNKSAAAATAATTPGGAGSANYAYGYGTQGSYGYGTNTGYYGYGYGPYGGGGGYGYGYNEGNPYPQQQQASTNAEWSQAAVTALTGQGYSGQTVLAALGLYEMGRPLSADQVGIVEAAIAAEGYPPIPGANGYPPALNQSSTTGGGTNVVPKCVGLPAGEAHNLIVAAGLVPKAVASQRPDMIVTSTRPAAGTKVKANSNVWIYASKKK